MDADIWEKFDFLKPLLPEQWQRIVSVVIGIVILLWGVAEKLAEPLWRWLLQADQSHHVLLSSLLLNLILLASTILLGYFLWRSKSKGPRQTNPVKIATESWDQFQMSWIVETWSTDGTISFKPIGPLCTDCVTPLHMNNYLWECPNEECRRHFEAQFSKEEMKERICSTFLGKIVRDAAKKISGGKA